jgi:hypothetical protein
MFKLLLLFVGFYTNKLNTRLCAIHNVLKSTRYVHYADVYSTGVDHRYSHNNKTKEETARQLEKCIHYQKTMNKINKLNNINVNYPYEGWVYSSVSSIVDDDNIKHNQKHNHNHNNMVSDLYSGLDIDF